MKQTAAQTVFDEKLSELSADKRELLELLFGQKDLTAEIEDETSAQDLSETEVKLKHIWEQILNIPAIGVDDNFFELGGDSIQCIQIVSRCRREELYISTAQMFENPTIAGLAKVLDETRNIIVEEATLIGEIPLLPIQNWFFGLKLENPHHWNQAMMFKVKSDVDVSAIEQAWQTGFDRHEALRYRYRETSIEWKQETGEEKQSVSFEKIDLSQFDRDSVDKELKRQADLLQTDFDLNSGRLLKIALFNFGDNREKRMLVTAHHIAVDGISFRVMLEDFQTVYQQIISGREISLPSKATSVAHWASRIKTYADSPEINKEIDFWNKIAASKKTLLPRDFVEGENTESSAETVEVFCSESETQALLQKTLQTFRTRINDVLIYALSNTLAEWTKQPEILIHLEGHGREEIARNTNVSRTVGWLTSIFPVRLKLPETENRAEKLNAVKRQLAEIPKHGVGYGIMRYAANEEVRKKLLPLDSPEIVFNYLGKFDGVLESNQPFAPSLEYAGKLYDGNNKRPFLIQVVCQIAENRFGATFYYSRNFHKKETIQTLAERFIEFLREIISDSQKQLSGKLSIVDFPHSNLSEAGFENLTKRFNSSESVNIEDIYALTPIQQGLLFHSIAEPDSGMYLEQGVCEIKGNLDLEKFRAAWERVQERHSILRTAFVWKDLTQPQQIVFRQVELPLFVTDWRKVPAGKKDAGFEEFIRTDREQGVDFTKAPLMRLSLFRMTDDSYKFVWTIHHLINDSWSTTSMLQEFFELYRNPNENSETQLVAPLPFISYVEWLKNQDVEAAENVWQEQMKGFISPTPILKGWKSTNSIGKGKYERNETAFSSEETRNINQFAASNHLTVNTVFQAAWGTYLLAISEKPDIVFGGVVSGRPTNLKNADNLVGVLINTLPIRFKPDLETEVLKWLQTVQQQQIYLRQYEYLSLKTIQKLSEAPSEQPLFDSVLVFQNATANFEGVEITGMHIEKVRYLGFPNYPLTLRVWLGDQIILETLFNRNLISRDQSKEILETVKQLVLQLISSPQKSLQDAIKLVRNLQKIKFQTDVEQRRSLFKAKLKSQKTN